MVVGERKKKLYCLRTELFAANGSRLVPCSSCFPVRTNCTEPRLVRHVPGARDRKGCLMSLSLNCTKNPGSVNLSPEKKGVSR